MSSFVRVVNKHAFSLSPLAHCNPTFPRVTEVSVSSVFCGCRSIAARYVLRPSSQLLQMALEYLTKAPIRAADLDAELRADPTAWPKMVFEQMKGHLQVPLQRPYVALHLRLNDVCDFRAKGDACTRAEFNRPKHCIKDLHAYAKVRIAMTQQEDAHSDRKGRVTTKSCSESTLRKNFGEKISGRRTYPVQPQCRGNYFGSFDRVRVYFPVGIPYVLIITFLEGHVVTSYQPS